MPESIEQQLTNLKQMAVDLERHLLEFRNANKESLHPWSLNPLANAIGAAANCACHLGSVIDQNAGGDHG